MEAEQAKKMVRVADGEAAIGDPVWTSNPKNGAICRSVLLVGDEIAMGEPFLVKRRGIYTTHEVALKAMEQEQREQGGVQ